MTDTRQDYGGVETFKADQEVIAIVLSCGIGVSTLVILIMMIMMIYRKYQESRQSPVYVDWTTTNPVRGDPFYHYYTPFPNF